MQFMPQCSYTPLQWEFNNTYFSEWMLGDIVSDDALKAETALATWAIFSFWKL